MKIERTLKFAPLFFWMSIVLVNLIRIIPLLEGKDLIYGITTIAITTPLDIISFLFFYYLVFPNIINNKRKIPGIFIGVLYLVLSGFVWVWVYKIIGRIEIAEENLMIYKASYGHTLLSIIYAFIVRLSVDWVKRNQEAQNLIKDKYDTELKLKDAELKLLKAQVHPHFLFNTLNNLYGLTLENSKKAPEVVIKLSALLDYVLYKCNTSTVSLTNEIAQVINYIDLEKLRYDDDLHVSFEQAGISNNKEIAPLLLLPFIENCFKHGVSKSSGKSWIKINIAVINNKLLFKAENNKSNNQEGSGYRYTEGIGLKNVKQRLELAYKENYDLDINETEDIFSVNLNINLQENNFENEMYHN